jgi:transposase InsO family protein
MASRRKPIDDLPRAPERFPGVTPRIISDNGPQFIARDVKEFIRLCGMTHVRTSPYYPQSNGKIERWHRILKEECIRPGTPLTLEDARRIVAKFVEYYNTIRACIRPLVTSRPRTNWRAGRRKSSPPATANSKPPAKGGKQDAKPPVRPLWTANPLSLQRNQRKS